MTLVAADPVAVDRIVATAELLAERGYAVTPTRLAELSGASERDVLGAARPAGRLRLVDGRVVPADSAHLAAPSRARQAEHDAHAPRALAIAEAYADALRRRCPWVRAVLACGSLASGGYGPGDDVDVSLVVEDGAKHLAYVAALAIALPFAWRHRGARSARSPERDLPLVPKLVCVNVVWTMGETAPFARSDDRMALELRLQRPLRGAGAWREVAERNAALFGRAIPAACPDDPPAPPSRVARLLRALAASPRRRRALDAAAYAIARAAHALVRVARWRKPAVRARVARLEATKHPYAILDRPRQGRLRA
jgi:predicted nucleotidyltransferase